jgi:predicted dehydrogenase
MSHRITRRTALKNSAVGAAAASFALSARSWGNVVGANEDIRIAVVGFNGRGNDHINNFGKMKGVRVVALCDADKAILDKGVAKLNKGDATTRPTAPPSGSPTAKRNGAEEAVQAKDERRGDDRRAEDREANERKEVKPTQVKGYQDLRKLLDDKEIDAVSTATPNHWHALFSIWACQAGKDVYVEKPVSHNVWEGRKIVEAARKYNKIVQTGTQSRSNGALREAFAWVREGNLGKIKIARGLCYKRRGTIGKTEGEQPIPASVDYDLWCGPAAKEPLRRAKLHYDWHWVWNTGNGDIGNQGIHEMDKCRWALGKDHLAPKIMSVGGRLGYDDDGETANTQFCLYDYGDVLLIFETRGLWSKARGSKMDQYRGESVGQVIECEDGYLVDATAYDNDHKEVRKFKAPEDHDGNHYANFIKAVRSRKMSDLNADILEGHLSSALCHLGNISHRLGQESEPAEIESAIKSNAAAMETWERFQEHLAANEVCLVMEKATLGVPLKLDPKTERFIGNDQANEMLTRKYRKGFEVPEQV